MLSVLQVVLTTQPDETGGTHWGQMTFQLHPPLQAEPGDMLQCKFDMARQPHNNRLLYVNLSLTFTPKDGDPSTTEHMYRLD